MQSSGVVDGHLSGNVTDHPVIDSPRARSTLRAYLFVAGRRSICHYRLSSAF